MKFQHILSRSLKPNVTTEQYIFAEEHTTSIFGSKIYNNVARPP